jgi:hypothetical protein
VGDHRKSPFFRRRWTAQPSLLAGRYLSNTSNTAVEPPWVSRSPWMSQVPAPGERRKKRQCQELLGESAVLRSVHRRPSRPRPYQWPLLFSLTRRKKKNIPGTFGESSENLPRECPPVAKPPPAVPMAPPIFPGDARTKARDH